MSTEVLMYPFSLLLFEVVRCDDDPDDDPLTTLIQKDALDTDDDDDGPAYYDCSLTDVPTSVLEIGASAWKSAGQQRSSKEIVLLQSQLASKRRSKRCREATDNEYHETSNKRRTLVGNKIVDHSDVVILEILRYVSVARRRSWWVAKIIDN